ncbi:TRAP transporter large permease [Roseomonas sp. CECT 9278]|uniref:TRAP transporter large permease n=1 Tax=Roseomonas sp. CECT 9278 TaxID=2845823 RepID=UPI001E45BA14|nr:TRAP transporter large permease [Roseomonas sp. CECT 9278]CAH0160277.1 Sialic acid TRAP transporter large permease protein SiaM [Roseomonas sp. CECT 9278]
MEFGLLLIFVVFGTLVVAGVPVAFCLGIAAATGFIYEGLNPAVVFQQMASGMSIFALLAIPFFIFAGEIMLHGGIARRLVALASAAVGWMRGGLGMVDVSTSMLFGGISGSAVADTSATGTILIPAMKAKGYGVDYAVSLTVTSSIAGILIPPSHNMILYSLAAGGGISVSALFIAGIVPGIVMCLSLALAAYVMAVRRGYPADGWKGFGHLLWAFIDALPGLLTAVIILGGVLSGIFTVTESAAFGAIWALAVTLLVYRALSWKDFVIAVRASVRTTSVVFLLVGTATAFAWLLAMYRLPDILTEGMLSISSNPIVIMLMINVCLLLLGCVMDMAALILITTPIFLPVVVAIGVDPVQFGMVMMMNLGLGLTTPPVGAVLFVGCAIGQIRIEDVLRTIWPFWGAILLALMLTTYWPAMSLTLPRLLLGYGA